MAKDYGRRRPIRQKSSVPKQLFWTLASFLCGYLAATVFDFTSLSSWVNANILAKHNKGKPEVKVAAKEPELPKPKFEFYTLLAKERANSSSTPSSRPAAHPAATIGAAPVIPTKQMVIPAKQLGTVAVTESKPVVSTSAGRETYQIQIASFKNRQDAEHLQAMLTLKGFDVSVVATSQPQGNWFRVIVGPFNSRIAAEKTQLSLVQNEHIKGMIRKIEV